MATLNYVEIFTKALTGEQREQRPFQYAVHYLEEIGLAQLLKAAVDKLITERCKYYYENSVHGCIQRPLECRSVHAKGPRYISFQGGQCRI